MKASELGVLLLLVSLDRRDDAKFEFDDALHNFPQDDANLPPILDPFPPLTPIIPPQFDVATSNLQPKWWA